MHYSSFIKYPDMFVILGVLSFAVGILTLWWRHKDIKKGVKKERVSKDLKEDILFIIIGILIFAYGVYKLTEF